MIITAKSAIIESNLKAKKILGAENIELHTFISDVENLDLIDSKLDILINSGLKIVSVHSPIDRICTLESMNTEIGMRLVDNSCYMAQRLSEIQGIRMNVVIHQESGFEQLINWGILDKVTSNIEKLLKKYNNIVLNIECLQVACVQDGKLHFRDSPFTGNLDMCKYLKEKLNTNRLGTVIDTCHILGNIGQLKRLGVYSKYNSETVESILKLNAEHVNIVHLANGRNIAFGKDHGCGFDTEKEIELLKDIMNKLQDIDFQGLLVLEVYEQDYLNCKSFDKLFKQVNEILDRND